MSGNMAADGHEFTRWSRFRRSIDPLPRSVEPPPAAWLEGWTFGLPLGLAVAELTPTLIHSES